MTKAGYRRRSTLSRSIGGTAALALLLFLTTTSAALADVTWSVTSSHGPQNMAPGGTGQYVIQAFNIGDANTSEQYRVEDTLPPGVTATAVLNPTWSCPGLPASGTVVCTADDMVRQPGTDSLTDARFRGAAAPLVLEVAVDPRASGTADNVVTVSGGSPGAVPATDTDPTPFSSTPAGFGFVPSSFVADVFDGATPSANPERQAGAHPFELHLTFDPNLALKSDPDAAQPFYTEADPHIKTLETRLPAGFIGNPQALPKCPAARLNSPGPNSKGACPANTQVGTIDLVLQDGKQIQGIDETTDIPVFNMQAPPGTVAALALSFIGNPVWIVVTLDPSDYSLVATISDQIELLTVRHADLALWGVPADPAHDRLRLNGETDDATSAMITPFTGAPIRPFLTLPSQCDAPGAIRMRADSWTSPGAFTPFMVGASATMTGCDDPRFEFKPTIRVQPESRRPGTPTGLDVELSVPQQEDAVPDAALLYAGSGDLRALPTPPLRDATVTLPEGMAVSPSSANGLAACSPLQIGLRTNLEPTCPDASKLGTMSIDTPLLPDPLTGSIYLATQSENPFGSLLALYLVAEGPGVIVKLPGKIVPNPVTGQLTATFDDNPQLPFTRMRLHFDGGPRAPLVTPRTCGSKTTTAAFTSWNASLPAVSTSDSFEISGDGAGGPCGPRGFKPGFVGGTTNPIAGEDSPLVTRISRGDDDEELGTVAAALPEGLLGRISRVELCAGPAADAGTCSEASRIGSVTVAAGPGSNPFFISDGRAYITGPYKGAPFGLSMVVRAKAGPLDLGDVVVRARIQVDPRTAALRVVTEPLPTILAGIPLQLRVAQVKVDRPGFAFNPTSCAEKRISATLTSVDGSVHATGSRFKVSDCSALTFKPRLGLRLVGKRQMRSGGHPTLRALLRQGPGQANIRSAKVTLPRSLVLDSKNVYDPGLLCGYDAAMKADCPASSIIGKANLRTPVLDRPLSGPVHLVQGIRFGKNGRRIRTLPTLLAKLRGEVAIDLRSRTRVDKSSRLVSVFPKVPDAPASRFSLQVNGGRKGILTVTQNRRGRISLCNTKQTALVEMVGHNGKGTDYPVRVKRPCKARKATRGSDGR